MTMMMIRERRRRRNKNEKKTTNYRETSCHQRRLSRNSPSVPPCCPFPISIFPEEGTSSLTKANYHFNAMQKKKKSSPQKMRERKAKQQNKTWKRQKNNNAEKKNEKERITKRRGKHKRTKMKKITRRKTWKKSQKSSESASRRRLSPARTCSCRLQFYRFADNRPLAEKFLKGLSFNPVRVWLPSRYS